MHTYTLSLFVFKPSSMLQQIVFSLQNVKLDLHIDNPHVTWIALSATGSVIAGLCTCIAG